MQKLTYEKAFRIFDYNPDTGDIFRKDFLIEECSSEGSYKSLCKMYAGKVTGYKKYYNNGMRYKVISHKGAHYRAHRVAALLMTKRWPKNIVDHIDGNGFNNKWANLRETTQAKNMRNRRMSTKTKSGVMGVHWNKRSGKWFSKITIDGRQTQIYYGDSFEEAVKSRKKHERELGYHDNHGRGF